MDTDTNRIATLTSPVMEDSIASLERAKVEVCHLPRGVTVFYKQSNTIIDNDGTLYDDSALELVDAFKDGQRIACDDYRLLEEVVSELNWNTI